MKDEFSTQTIKFSILAERCLNIFYTCVVGNTYYKAGPIVLSGILKIWSCIGWICPRTYVLFMACWKYTLYITSLWISCLYIWVVNMSLGYPSFNVREVYTNKFKDYKVQYIGHTNIFVNYVLNSRFLLVLS